MGQLYTLEGIRRQRRRPQQATFFSRSELNQLLSLYSRRVISGEWRDYAIDQRDGMALFSVFRHSHDRPLFSIAKRAGPAGCPSEFLVLSGRQKLRRAKSIGEALTVFEHKFKVIS